MNRLEEIKKDIELNRKYLFENNPDILDDGLWLISEIEQLRRFKNKVEEIVRENHDGDIVQTYIQNLLRRETE